MIILSIFIVIFLYACNILAVYHGLQKPTKFTDVKLAFYFLIAALVIFPILDFIIYGVIIRIFFQEGNICNVNSSGYEEIPSEESEESEENEEIQNEASPNEASPNEEIQNKASPNEKIQNKASPNEEIQNEENQNEENQNEENQNEENQNEENHQRLNKLEYIYLYCSMVLSLLLTQLVFLNGFYILLAVTAAPVETGSLAILYITSLFSLLAFFALILKIFSANNFQTRGAICCYFVSLTFLVLLLAAGIGMFVLFIYTYTVLIQEYRNDKGVLAFFSSFVPSVIATVIGSFWVELIYCF